MTLNPTQLQVSKQFALELETEVREDFTITEEGPYWSLPLVESLLADTMLNRRQPTESRHVIDLLTLC